jgi:hypothetical protein
MAQCGRSVPGDEGESELVGEVHRRLIGFEYVRSGVLTPFSAGLPRS